MCASRIALHGLAVELPCLKDRVDPAPGRFHFVAAHEQGLVAAHHIHDEALIGIRVAILEGFRKAHVERHVAQAHSTRTGILDHQPLLHAFVRLQADDKLIGNHLARAFAKDGMRNGLERDDDFRNTRGKALAGAQIERHPQRQLAISAFSATNVSVLLVSLSRSSR